MHSTITIGQVLQIKGGDLIAISPCTTAYEALEFMAETSGRSWSSRVEDWP